jgi:hypothetical protein
VSKWGKTYWADTAERVGSSTIVIAVVDVTAYQTGELDLQNATKVLVATGLLTLLKCLGANLKNSNSGPSLLPAPPAPPVVDPPPDPAPHVDYPGGNP